MTITGLRFEVTWSFPYPITTTGSGTALTICVRSGDICLAFLTQTSGDDEVLYLHPFTGDEQYRHPTPPGYLTISGMAYDPFRRLIWCCELTVAPEVILTLDPETGSLTGTQVATPSPTMSAPHGLACNGFFFVRGGGSTLELWATNGVLLGTHRYTGRSIRGVSASPWSYCFVDTDEIVVIGPMGNELAVSSGIGTSGGMEAIAFDYIDFIHMDDIPQVWGPDGSIGDPGTIYNPDTPWNPEPWAGRHRLYVANEIDQTIYAGYLTAD